MHPGKEGGGEEHGHMRRRREREKWELHWVLHPMGFYLEVLVEDLNRLFISFPGVSFQGQGPGLHRFVLARAGGY